MIPDESWRTNYQDLPAFESSPTKKPRPSRKPLLIIVALVGMVAVLLALGPGITGFTIATGSQTQNLGMTVYEDSVIPLTIADTLSSFSLTGEYIGTGNVIIHLIGSNDTRLVAYYQAPAASGTRTVVLGKGGTVVELGASNMTYRHVFDLACEETCATDMQGPFYLQVKIVDGATVLTSVTYDSPDLFVQETTPPVVNETFNVTQPVPVGRENPPPECSAASDCGQGFACVAQYCVSETGHFNVTDREGRVVALFDKFGTVLLAGSLYEHSSASAPANALRFSSTGTDKAWVTDAGDLHLTGNLLEELAAIPVTGTDNFLIRNESDYVCMIQGATGNMYTVSSLVERVLP